MWSQLNKIGENSTLSDGTKEKVDLKENLKSLVWLFATVSKLYYGKEIMSYIMHLHAKEVPEDKPDESNQNLMTKDLL